MSARSVCVGERDRERLCAWEREKGKGRERVCVCVCVFVWQYLSVSIFVFLWLCLCPYVHVLVCVSTCACARRYLSLSIGDMHAHVIERLTEATRPLVRARMHVRVCAYMWRERCLLITKSPRTPGHYRYLIWVLVYIPYTGLAAFSFAICSCSCVYCDFEFLEFVFSTLQSRSAGN